MERIKRTAVFVLAAAMLTLSPLRVYADSTVTGSGTSAADPKVTVTVTETDGQKTNATTTEWSDTDSETGFGTSFTETESTTESGACQSGFTEGREMTKSEQTPQVTVTVTPGGEASASSDIDEGTTGNLKADDPKNYDQTTVTVTQREVTATAGDTDVTVNTGSGNSLSPVTPVWTGNEQDISKDRPDRFGTNEATGPDGYDFRYTGWGQDSYYGSYVTSTYEGENGETTSVTKESDILHFLLTDTTAPDSPDHVAYCLDVCTGVHEGWWYRIDNLESAGYYPDENAENHIRAIVNNGYWGTGESDAGSLSQMAKMLTDKQQNGTDEEKALLSGLDFSLMTEGEAQAATQMAIWQYGNRFDGALSVELSASNYNGSYGWTYDEEDEAAWARINAAYKYLITLTEEKGDTTDVITEDKFIESVSLTVKDKAADGADDSNDSYYADLCFVLAVVPGENDSLTVKVYQNGEIVGETSIMPNQTEYTIEGLTLTENSDVRFDLAMTGAQYLEKGVYVYTSEVREGEGSQSFVGLCEGERSVDISMSMTMSFDVADAVVLSERIWRSEWTKVPDYDDDDSEDDPPISEVPLADVPNTGVDLPGISQNLLPVLGIILLRSKKSK